MNKEKMHHKTLPKIHSCDFLSSLKLTDQYKTFVKLNVNEYNKFLLNIIS